MFFVSFYLKITKNWKNVLTQFFQGQPPSKLKFQKSDKISETPIWDFLETNGEKNMLIFLTVLEISLDKHTHKQKVLKYYIKIKLSNPTSHNFVSWRVLHNITLNNIKCSTSKNRLSNFVYHKRIQQKIVCSMFSLFNFCCSTGHLFQQKDCLNGR